MILDLLRSEGNGSIVGVITITTENPDSQARAF